MNTVRHEAVSIVHAGLTDVLRWLGEAPIEPWEPRHAADWERIEVHTFLEAVRVDHFQVPN